MQKKTEKGANTYAKETEACVSDSHTRYILVPSAPQPAPFLVDHLKRLTFICIRSKHKR